MAVSPRRGHSLRLQGSDRGGRGGGGEVVARERRAGRGTATEPSLVKVGGTDAAASGATAKEGTPDEGDATTAHDVGGEPDEGETETARDAEGAPPRGLRPAEDPSADEGLTEEEPEKEREDVVTVQGGDETTDMEDNTEKTPPCGNRSVDGASTCKGPTEEVQETEGEEIVDEPSKQDVDMENPPSNDDAADDASVAPGAPPHEAEGVASPAPSDDTVPAGNTGRRRGRKGGARDAGAPPARRTAEVSRDARDETTPLDESATVDGDDAEKKLPCSNAPADGASADEGPTEEDPEQEEGKVVREHAERDVDGEDPLDKKEAADTSTCRANEKEDPLDGSQTPDGDARDMDVDCDTSAVAPVPSEAARRASAGVAPPSRSDAAAPAGTTGRPADGKGGARNPGDDPPARAAIN